MEEKLTYEELERKVRDLERESRDQGMREQVHLQYQNIISSTLDGIAVVDRGYRYILVNDAYERFSGVDRHRFIGRTIAEYLGQEVFEEQIKPSFDRCLNGEVIHFQEWFDYPTLGRRFVDVTYYPYRDECNRISGVIANTRDITERTQAFEDLKRLNQDLALRTRIAHAFLTSPLDQVYADVLGFLLEEFESDYGYLGYIDDAGDLVCPSMTRDIWEQCRLEEKSIVFPRRTWGGLWGASLVQQQSLVRNGALHPPQGHIPLSSALVVPMMVQGSLVGQIALANREAGYGSEQQERLESVAEFMAPILRLGIERANAQRELQEQAVKLEERNTALNVLLEHRDDEKRSTVERIMGNFEKLVFPYLEKLETGRTEGAAAYLSIVRKNIRESLAPLGGGGAQRYPGFTPSEILVADLIRAGKTSREIADLMGISLRSVYFHRNNIRKKLNMSNKKANLQAFLSVDDGSVSR